MSTSIVACRHCGAKNRIPADRPAKEAKCGRCHRALDEAPGQNGAVELVTLRCSQCRTKNRVPVARIHQRAKCGRCGTALQHEEVLTGSPVMVTDANFDQTVLASPLPVLLYGWAPWCSVCGGTNSMVDQLAAEVKGKFRVAKLNIESNPQLAGQYNVLSVPTFFIFDGGELKQQLPGAVPRHDLLLKMAAYL